jgi:hypothetical protein
MQLQERIGSFEILGACLRRFREHYGEEDMADLDNAVGSASAHNAWFTAEMIGIMFDNLGHALNPDNLDRWLEPYRQHLLQHPGQKRIGVVMAGNIPAVGFHDFLCVLISGNKLVAKLSSADEFLLPAMAAILIRHNPEWQSYISFTTGRLENFDAIIATGNSNTARYFDFYFERYPHIIRGNRNSVAVLNGLENASQLEQLADDIMLFFGMGCRSISKIYVPSGYNFIPMIHALEKYRYCSDHHKYCNNYDYNKSIFLVSQVPFLDNGFLLFKEDAALASRIALVHFEYYENPEEVIFSIRNHSESVQCVVSCNELPIMSVKPGKAQKPELWDYADDVDTMEFLLSGIPV